MHPDEMRQVGSAIFFRGRQISDATVKRFGRFQEIAAQCDGVKQKMAAAMPRELADTYFFYYYFLARGRSNERAEAQAGFRRCGGAARAAGCCRLASPARADLPTECAAAGRLPRIRPDYSQIVIPPNIAPLNFLVEEPAAGVSRADSRRRRRRHRLASRGPSIVIPPRPWRELLAEEPRRPDRAGDLRKERAGPLVHASTRSRTTSRRRTSTRISSTGCWDRWPTATATWGSIGATWRTTTSRRS